MMAKARSRSKVMMILTDHPYVDGMTVIGSNIEMD